MVHPILIQRLVSRFQVFPWPYRFTLLTLNLILSLFILWTCLNTCFTLFFFLKIEFPILKIPLLYNQIEYSFIIVVVRNFFFFFSLIDCWLNFSVYRNRVFVRKNMMIFLVTSKKGFIVGLIWRLDAFGV